MIETLWTRHRQVPGLILAVCFTASMFICGDAGCLSGNGNEDCALLLCSLLNKHDAPSQNAGSGADKDCSCVCHVPTILTAVFSFDYHPFTYESVLIASFAIPAAPIRLVYHPPAAV